VSAQTRSSAGRLLRAQGRLVWVALLLFFREPAAFGLTVVAPAVLVVMFGASFGNKAGSSPLSGFGFVDLATPALATVVIGTAAFMGIPPATATARELKILRRYRATPLPPVLYVVADVLANLVVGSLGMVLLVVVARVAFGLRVAGSWPELAAAFLLCSVSLYAVGYLIASLARSARMAQAAGLVLFLPMLFLSGATLPRSLMPEALRNVSDYLPLSQVVGLLQGLWVGDPWQDHMRETWILVAMLAVGVILSARTFRWE
jgi:ABC-2 type transport system permease protein